MDRQAFGGTRDGQAVELYTLRTRAGLRARVMTYGATLTSLEVPDRQGRLANVVLGFDALEGYLGGSGYVGAIVGRYANRIAGGRLPLGDRAYALTNNDGANHLHGGARGFDKVVWRAEPLAGGGGSGLRLRYTSPDGEEGYPGTLEAAVVYTLTEDGALGIEYTATTDRPTVVNLSHHSYFNLAGGGDVLGHQLTIDADRFTPVDQALIPTGERRAVAGTPFDFRRPTAVGTHIDDRDPQLAAGAGYDHNFVLNAPGSGLRAVARLGEPRSGRVMDVFTTEPGLHLFTDQARRRGVCLETQHFPDSPNRPEFPSTRLEPGQRYQSATVYRFAAIGGEDG
jgi:aldose 1-epimerase